MVNFPNITTNINLIAHRSVECTDDSNEISSWKGRGISLLHTLATPLKALTGLGKLALSVMETVSIILAVLTLNKHPKDLDQAGANVIDIVVGSLLLPVALVAHFARGVVGSTIHPTAMIKKADIPSYETMHNLMHGTLVNYEMV